MTSLLRRNNSTTTPSRKQSRTMEKKLLLLNRMPYHLELGSDGHSFAGKAIVVNSKTGKHYSRSPIEMNKAKAQKRVLEQAMKKKESSSNRDE